VGLSAEHNNFKAGLGFLVFGFDFQVLKVELALPEESAGASRGVTSFSFSPGFNRVTAVNLVFL
jgi:hypothetical protein